MIGKLGSGVTANMNYNSRFSVVRTKAHSLGENQA